MQACRTTVSFKAPVTTPVATPVTTVTPSGAGADEIENKYEQLHSNSMELHMAAATALDSNLTINEIVTRFPETIPVFNRFGLDICCGGGVRVDEAAQRDGLDAAEVLSALRLVLERR
jgi:regulator of cell morphogenesis and NO signaling